MNRPGRLLTVVLATTLLASLATSPAFAKDDESHGGVEPGTHLTVELPDDNGGTGSGTTPKDPGTLVIHEDAPPIDPGADVYPDTEDKTPAKIRTQFGGMTDDERTSAGGGSGKGGDGSTGADKKGDGRTVDTTMTVNNPDAGKSRPSRGVAFQTFTARSSDGDIYGVAIVNNPKDLSKVATVTPVTSSNSAGVSTVFAYSIVFDPTVNTDYQEGVIRNIFWVTGGLFSKCTSHQNYNFCTVATPKTMGNTRAPLTTAPRERSIPICSNTMKDGGFGATTVFTVADVDCEAVPGKEPVRLEVGTIYSDGTKGLPTSRAGDGSIVYSATAVAAGSYVSADVWAVAADGTYSMPFTIAIRNRFAPTPDAANLPDQTGTVRPLEAIRGVDTVIPANRLFSDIDVDQHPDSGDHLASVVTEQGAMGGAWFDAKGDLHYQSIDVIRGEYTDHVTVRTTDAFGLPSPELRLSIHITDITPGCATGSTTTDAHTPARIQLTCWITPAEGWHQIDGITYRITAQPRYGTVSDLDPVSGVATYTPDPAHPEPATIGFTATNNGATREASYTVNVLSAP